MLSRRLFVRSAAGITPLLVFGPALGCGGDDGSVGDGDGGDGHGGDGGRDAAMDASAGDGGLDAAMADAAGPADGGDHDAGAGSQECFPFLTPEEDFPQLFGGNGTVPGWERPEIDADTFRLEVDGLVDSPLSVSLDELLADTEHHQRIVHTILCVFGLRGTAIFEGVPVRTLLQRAGLREDDTRRVRFHGADGFHDSLPLDALLSPPAELAAPMVAVRMNGHLLDPMHGFPTRLIVPGRHGFKNTKWLQRIEATDSQEAFSRYADAGLSDGVGVIRPISLAENVRRREPVEAGTLRLCGTAISGRAGIAEVQVSLDGTPFRSATLTTLDEQLRATPALAGTLQADHPDDFPYPYRGVWVTWEIELQLAAGQHTVSLRVVDRELNNADGFNVSFDAV